MFYEVFLQSLFTSLVHICWILEAVGEVGVHVVGALHKSVCIFSPDELFICWDAEHLCLAVVCRNACLCVASEAVLVLLKVNLNTHELKSFQTAATDDWRALAYTSGEYDCVYRANFCHVRTNVFAEASCFHID